MQKLFSKSWFSNTIISLTAVCFLYSQIQFLELSVPSSIFLIPFGITFIGYTFIRKLDQNQAFQITKMEFWGIVGSLLCLLPSFQLWPISTNKWMVGLICISLTIVYIFPIKTFRLRNYWWSKSLTITLIWLSVFSLLLLPSELPITSKSTIIYYVCSVLLLLTSCWVYDIQESRWTAKKIKIVKTIAIINLLILLILHNYFLSTKNGAIILLTVFYCLHITRLKKEYRPAQNVWIDIYLGLSFLALI